MYGKDDVDPAIEREMREALDESLPRRLLAVPDFADELEPSQLEGELTVCSGCGFALLPGEDRKTVRFEDGPEVLEAVVHNKVCEDRWHQRIMLEQADKEGPVPYMP